MKKVKIGIIGCGVIGPTHIESYQRVPGVEVAWACDLDLKRAKAAAEKYGIPCYTREAEAVFVSDVDAVSVCTDHASHCALALAALAAGKDVLCEKALANSPENLRRMVAAAKKYEGERIFAGVFQHRFDPINRAVRDILASGALGTLLSANLQICCRRTNEYYRADKWRGTWAKEGGSVLINQGIHYLDQLQWQTGGVKEVTGFYSNLTHKGVIQTEDTATAAVRFKNGALGTITATCSSHLDWDTSLRYYGSEGTIEIANDKPVRVLCRDGKLAAKLMARLQACENAPKLTSGKSYYGTGHAAQIADFVDAVRKRRAPFVPATEAADAVRLLFGIYKAQRDHLRVKV